MPANRPRPTSPTVARLVAVLACVGLAACGPGGVASEPGPTTDPAPSPTTPEPAARPEPTPEPVPTAELDPIEPSPEPSGETMSETPVRIVIGDQVLEGRLWDNPGARSLLDQLPLTLDFSDYGGQEVLATPPRPITMAGMPAGESAPAGTIGYYAPGDVVVLYYTDVGRWSGIVRLGHIDSDVSVLRDWDTARTVTIERAG